MIVTTRIRSNTPYFLYPKSKIYIPLFRMKKKRPTASSHKANFTFAIMAHCSPAKSGSSKRANKLQVPGTLLDFSATSLIDGTTGGREPMLCIIR
jgi:hypothetical protein